MAAKAKETGNIDFIMFYRLFLVYIKVGIPTFAVNMVQCQQWESNFSENALCFQGFLRPLLFLLSQIWDKKGNHLTKHDFLISAVCVFIPFPFWDSARGIILTPLLLLLQHF